MSYNVLIVDDSRSMRKVIKKALTLSGFDLGEWWEAQDGREALQVLEKNWVDLVLCDFHMPVMNGLDFLKAVKSVERYQDLPVVFITTESNQERLRELVELGASGYLRKPFHPEQICRYLGSIMGEDHATGNEMAGTDEGCDF